MYCCTLIVVVGEDNLLSRRTGDETGEGGCLLVDGLDVLGHEHPVRHVAHEVEHTRKVVAHQRLVLYQSFERDLHI